jgi:hypothetical protein
MRKITDSIKKEDVILELDTTWLQEPMAQKKGFSKGRKHNG